jgi:hypothetical protein
MMRWCGPLALLVIAVCAVWLGGQREAQAQGWTSKESLKGSYFNAGQGISIATDSTIRFAKGDSSGLVATSAEARGGVRWWFFSLSAACSLRIYSEDIPGDSLSIRSHASTLGGDLLFPGLRNGIDSITVYPLAGSISWIVWGMN